MVCLFTDPEETAHLRFPIDPSLVYDQNTGEFIAFSVPNWHPVARRISGGADTPVDSSMDFTGEGLRDRNGHGTIVALVALGASAEPCRLLVGKVFAETRSTGPRELARAIAWAADSGAGAINLSAGIFNKRCRGTCEVCRSATRATEAGIPITAAAGNRPGEVACPARLGTRGNALVIAVELTSDRRSTQTPVLGVTFARPSNTTLRRMRLGVPSAQVEAAVQMHRAGDLAGARAAYEALIRDGDESERSTAAVNLGKLLTTLGERAAAQAAYERAEQIGLPYDAAVAGFELGCLLRAAADRVEAAAAFRRAAATAGGPASAWAAFNLANLLRDTGDVAGAAAWYRSVIDDLFWLDASMRPKAAINLGVLLEDAGDVAGARAAYTLGLGAAEEEIRDLAKQYLAQLLSRE